MKIYWRPDLVPLPFIAWKWHRYEIAFTYPAFQPGASTGYSPTQRRTEM